MAEGASKLPGHIVDAWHNATVDLPNTLMDPARRKTAGQAMGEALGGMVDSAKGYAQQVRDLSPPQYRGSAPTMSTAPAEAMERGVVNRYGVNVSPKRLGSALAGDFGEPNLNAYRTAKDAIAEHPLSVAALAAPVVGKPLAAGLKAVAPAVGKLNPIPAVARVMDAGATPAAQEVRSAALGKVLAQQQAAREAEEAAARLKGADAPLRAKMEGAASEQAAIGVGVSDVPQAQSLVAELSGRLNPNGPVATTPTAGQAAAYKAVMDVLAPSKGPKPSLEMVQNLRRELAEAAYGGADPRGFGAISKLDKRDLVQRLHEIEDAYTGGASTPVRENWSAAMTAQEQADEMAKLKNKLATDAAQLDTLPPAEAVTRAKSIVASLSKKGLVPDAEYREFLELANAATNARGKSAFRKQLALWAGAGAVGISATGAGIAGHVTGILP